jgi:hypothetical protein
VALSWGFAARIGRVAARDAKMAAGRFPAENHKQPIATVREAG